MVLQLPLSFQAIVALVQILPEAIGSLFYQLLGVYILFCVAPIIFCNSCTPQKLGLRLCAPDPNIFSVVEDYQTCFVLNELHIHAQYFYLMDSLNVIADFVTVF